MFRILGLAVALSNTLAIATFADPPPAPSPPSKFVVHEWGVLTIGHVGESPLLGASDKFLASLPDFVLQHEHVPPSNPTISRPFIVRKPVIHLYGNEGQNVEITVDVADGIPLVYYPKPELTTKIVISTTKDGHFGGKREIPSMTWKFSLTKKDPVTLSEFPPDHWWGATRTIPSDYVIMEDGRAAERFLFYEGSTIEKPTVITRVSEESFRVSNQDPVNASSPVILIINDKGDRSGAYIESIASGGSENLTADNFQPWDENTLFENCRKQWIACGMTPDEAHGIVESWRPELLDTPGILLISRIPNSAYQRIFPIKVTPEPDELVRACLIFDSLPAQNGRKHWLPKLEKVGRALIARLSDPDFKTRLQAHAKLVELGEVMSPWVQEEIVAPSSDAQSRMAAKTLLDIFAESKVCPHLPASPLPAGFDRGRILPLAEIPLIEIPVGKP